MQSNYFLVKHQFRRQTNLNGIMLQIYLDRIFLYTILSCLQRYISFQKWKKSYLVAYNGEILIFVLLHLYQKRFKNIFPCSDYAIQSIVRNAHYHQSTDTA